MLYRENVFDATIISRLFCDYFVSNPFRAFQIQIPKETDWLKAFQAIISRCDFRHHISLLPSLTDSVLLSLSFERCAPSYEIAEGGMLRQISHIVASSVCRFQRLSRALSAAIIPPHAPNNAHWAVRECSLAPSAVEFLSVFFATFRRCYPLKRSLVPFYAAWRLP